MRKLKIKEFSDIIGIAPSTIRDWELKGRFHPSKSPSGVRYYDENSLNEAVQLNLITKEDMVLAIQSREERIGAYK